MANSVDFTVRLREELQFNSYVSSRKSSQMRVYPVFENFLCIIGLKNKLSDSDIRQKSAK